MLTRTDLKTLKTKAQHLDPVVLIGAKGLTIQVHEEIEIALTAHQLIKIRVNAGSKEQRQTMVSQMVSKHEADIVQQIGHIVVLYRPLNE